MIWLFGIVKEWNEFKTQNKCDIDLNINKISGKISKKLSIATCPVIIYYLIQLENLMFSFEKT